MKQLIAKRFIVIIFFTLQCNAAPVHQKNTEPKSWNFLVYLAANNDLHKFANRNLKEMQNIGSNKHINLIAQLDTFGKKEISRFFIKNKTQECIEKKKNTKECISGTPESLFSFVKWATKHYPAKHTALILWNHGSGIKDPAVWGKLLPPIRNHLFEQNSRTGMYEVSQNLLRGIAFNDTFETYLTNAELKTVLQKISTQLLGGKKIDILGMDACHMAMLEVGSQVKDSARYLVASQEIEPGDGWNYNLTLKPFKEKALTPQEFATQIVTAYATQYNHVFADLTLSAIDLEKIETLEQNVSAAGKMLNSFCKSKNQKQNLRTIITNTRKSSFATYTFLDGDYIDLHHFCKSLRKKTKKIPEHKALTNQLKTIEENIATCVIANAVGQNIPQVKGISIYFPEKQVHRSYPYSDFGKTNQWTDFLYKFTKKPKLTRS